MFTIDNLEEHTKGLSVLGIKITQNDEELAFRVPFVYKPGTQFVYNNAGPYLVGILVQRRAGCDLASYLKPRLFDWLGIKKPTWEIDPLGNSFGAGGLSLTLSELHKFGLFYLHKGEWNGKQLLNSGWIEESTRQQGGCAVWVSVLERCL